MALNLANNFVRYSYTLYNMIIYVKEHEKTHSQNVPTTYPRDIP
jgi:hypothetical protein